MTRKKEKPMLPIHIFHYTGVIAHVRTTFAPYKATFKEWTPDPGVAVFTCDDGHERLIPTTAVEGFRDLGIPAQPKVEDNPGLIIGQSCTSEDIWDGVMPTIRTEDANAGFLSVVMHSAAGLRTMA